MGQHNSIFNKYWRKMSASDSVGCKIKMVKRKQDIKETQGYINRKCYKKKKKLDRGLTKSVNEFQGI